MFSGRRLEPRARTMPAPSAARPFSTFVLSVVAALSVSAAALWAARAHPELIVIGAHGRHDARGDGARAATCLDCHVPFLGTPSSRCLGPGCHGELATGTPPRDGPAMPIRFHAALREQPCGRCHDEHGAAPSPARRFDHAVIPSEVAKLCSRCHGADRVPDHPRTRTDVLSCELCHGLENWRGTPMEHARVASESCDVCHRAPEAAPHLKTGGACQECHGTSQWTEPGPDR